MSTRAKFYCQAEVRRMAAPYRQDRYQPKAGEPTSRDVWPREYEFSAVPDGTAEEDARFTWATPVGKLTMTVDNPEVAFIPGRHYYLDFTLADES